ncbi:amino acid permease [Streptomyces sp. NPDC010273]|uniref:amino acid permease n=1 Tax=Streptomyces sp. NPDC010273 TaxID=3364829 RepID=UPI0036ED51B5
MARRYSYARDGVLPFSKTLSSVSKRSPVVALAVAGVVPILFTLLVNVMPSHTVHVLWFDVPAGVKALTLLVSCGVSGICLSFLLTVIGSMVARSRDWEPAGAFRFGRWGWPVSIVSAGYLAETMLNIIRPSSLSSPRGGLFNYGWLTLVVMLVLLGIGGAYVAIARPHRRLTSAAQPAAEGAEGASRPSSQPGGRNGHRAGS